MVKRVQRLAKYSLIILVTCLACNGPTKPSKGKDPVNPTPTVAKTPVPQLNADSAYFFIEKQVEFGPRVPGTRAHYNTFLFLREWLNKYADTVFVQDAKAETFDKKTIPIYNIIGSFNPELSKRVMLFAHWDTRPFADEDDSAKTQPILGANDGASGVGLLLEIARLIHENQLKRIGVDIIFFDAEDWGNGAYDHSYCLGSQYWGKNPHIPNYQADYGILLDMVGAKGAQFAIEGFSNQYAPFVVSKVWNTAAMLGHANTFVSYNRGYVTDDHYYVNKYTGIPVIDIIHYEPKVGQSFGTFWHTHDDNMDIIDKTTLSKVGNTLLNVLYNE